MQNTLRDLPIMSKDKLKRYIVLGDLRNRSPMKGLMPLRRRSMEPKTLITIDISLVVKFISFSIKGINVEKLVSAKIARDIPTVILTKIKSRSKSKPKR